MKKFTNDHRTRVTKMLIRKAFTQLLVNKPIQSISIKELCEKAGINRGTFYAHYKDIYDLRSQIEDEMQKELEAALKPLTDQADKGLTPVRITTEIFQCLKDNSDLCTVTLGEYGDKDFFLRLLRKKKKKCVDAYSKYFETVSPKKIEYFYAFASSGCVGLLRLWLSDGMTASAEEMAQFAEDIMMKGIACLKS